jgi:C4-dicarboxylate-specific signal transduction histidine kinase
MNRGADPCELAQTRRDALHRFAAGIAHDLNNHLVAIATVAELACDGLPEGSAPRQDLERIGEAVARTTELARRLTTLARRAVPRSLPVEVAPLLAAAAESFRTTLAPEVEVQLHPVVGLPPVLADRAQLLDALQNLAAGVDVLLSDGGRCVLSAELEPSSAGALIRIEVALSGEGLAGAPRPDLLEPYALARGGDRAGLALALVDAAIHRLAGSIDLGSNAAGGWRFTLRLPSASGLSPSAPQ